MGFFFSSLPGARPARMCLYLREVLKEAPAEKHEDLALEETQKSQKRPMRLFRCQSVGLPLRKPLRRTILVIFWNEVTVLVEVFMVRWCLWLVHVGEFKSFIWKWEQLLRFVTKRSLDALQQTHFTVKHEPLIAFERTFALFVLVF